MRTIIANEITNVIKNLCIEANYSLPNDIEKSLSKALEKETSLICKSALEDVCQNLIIAKEKNLPICQDTGMVVVFLEIGQDIHIEGDLNEAVNQGVRQGYLDGYLRKSIVKDPLKRVNTNDNTPAIIHTDIVKGDKIKITVVPKGMGSENMSVIKMFNPSVTKDDIISFIVDSVNKAGSNPCPPIVVGVGIGGNFEYCAYLSKKALIRNIDEPNTNEFYKVMEKETLEQINKTGIGTAGFGGTITALAVNIEVFPTHIAGLPVAVNIGCHVSRHKSIII